MNSKVAIRAIGVTLLLSLSACAASPYSVQSAPKAFLPHRAEVAEAPGKRTIAPDGTVVATPVGWRLAGQLEGDVIGKVVGKEFAFEAGESLAMAHVSGSAAKWLPAGARAMCRTPDMNVAKRLMAASTLGISSLFNRTGMDTQVCLIDAEGDGMVEQAILSGVKSEEDAEPIALTPVAYKIMPDAVMPGKSEARIVYRGKTGMIGGHISFDLQVQESGTSLAFDNVRTRVDIGDLPKRVDLMSTSFTVLSYDPETGHAEVELHNGFRSASYGIHRTYTTQYMPVNVPG